MADISWIHVSDWHHSALSSDRQLILDKLLEDIKSRGRIDKRLKSINFIFFTGDIASTGQQQEFNEAKEKLIKPIIEILGDKVPILFCPGNHDINRQEIGNIPAEWAEIAAKLDGYSEELEDLIRSKPKSTLICAPFKNYYDFCEEFGQKYAEGALHYARTFDQHGRRISVSSINTAWHSARYNLRHSQESINVARLWDYGALKVTEAQLRGAIKATEGADLKILIMHHPVNWLSEDDQIRVSALIKRNFDVVLNGHEHKPDMNVLSGGAGNVLQIPAGASFNRRTSNDPRYTNSYNYCSLDSLTLAGNIFHRIWNEEEDQWTDDDRYWERGKSSFLINNTDKDRFAARRSLMFDVEKEFAPALAKRIATVAKVEISHEPIYLDGQSLLRMRVSYSFSYEPGRPEEFKIKSSPSPVVRDMPSQTIQDQIYKFEGASPSTSVCGFDSEARDSFLCVIPIDEGPVTVSFQYSCLEAQNDVFIWRLKRFTGDIELTIHEADGYDYNYTPLGGFPPLRPEVGIKKGIRRVSSKDRMHLPGQGYLIQWRPRAS